MAKTPTDILFLARAHTETAINVLKRVMTSPRASAAARVAAAQALLDRGWGKAPQSITADVNAHYVARLPELEPDLNEWQRKQAPLRTCGQ